MVLRKNEIIYKVKEINARMCGVPDATGNVLAYLVNVINRISNVRGYIYESEVSSPRFSRIIARGIKWLIGNSHDGVAHVIMHNCESRYV